MVRSEWKSRLGFLAAVIGSAIGLGNIWRFPFLAYRNGGGAFLIPYLIALVTVGIPLMIMEQGVGHFLRASAPLSFMRINRRFELPGWWMVTFATFGILLYYCVVLGWCVNYLFYSFTLAWGQHTQHFFENSLLHLSKGPFQIDGIQLQSLVGIVVVWFANWVIIFRGIRKGIEIANLVLMPLLFVIMIVLVAWGVTLPGAVDGIKAYLSPDFGALKNPRVWVDAFTQIFFTLSLGFGIMIAYASYLPSKAEIKKNSYITCLTNCGFGIFAGLAVFSVLGFMAMETGVPIDAVAKGGPGLAFVVYPHIVNHLPFAGRLFGILFFLALIFAGITSSISVLESFISSLIDKFGCQRKKASSIVCGLGLLTSLAFATNAGFYWVDIVDYFLNHFGLMIAGLLETVLIAWVLKASNLREHINQVSDSKLGNWWVYLLKWWIPLILVTLLAADIVTGISKPYGGYSWNELLIIGCGWLMATVIGAAILTKFKWKRVIDDK